MTKEGEDKGVLGDLISTDGDRDAATSNQIWGYH
jgi:hypothetical protein